MPVKDGLATGIRLQAVIVRISTTKKVIEVKEK
jgi:hypothetical protein